jgi:signal transduction histidine kinase
MSTSINNQKKWTTNSSSDVPAFDADSSEALRFEKLLGEMLRAFMGLTVDEIDGQIEHWLRRIVLELGVDRSILAQLNSEHKLQVSHSWGRPGLAPIPRGLDGEQAVPILVERVLAGEQVVLSSPRELPPEALKEREFSRDYGTQATVMIPLSIGGAVQGLLTFGSVTREREWAPRLVQRLGFIAEILASVLDRRRALSELNDLRREIDHGARLSMMGELTASIAHELNQPLGAILNNAQAANRLLSADEPDIEEAKAALADIIRDDRRAVEIIASIRSVLRKSGSPKMPLEVGSLLLEAEQILGKDVKTKDVLFRIETPRGSSLIIGDKTQLLQVMVNLLMNAFDAVAENEQEPRSVVVSVFQQESRVHVQIRDSGKGIDPAIMPRLFNAFVTSKPRGMGIGLAIAHSIVEEHGGRLWAAQNADRGATLEFSLPAFMEPADLGS